jgi:O-antigen/teichoic acid export membrane protein
VHLGLALVSAPLVLFGDRMIDVLTNNKLTGAWVFLAPWCLVVILQSTGKPATGILYAGSDTRTVAKIGAISSGVVLVALAVLVPLWGAPGAVAAVLVQTFVYRVLLQLFARRRAVIPFQDRGAIAAGLLVGVLFTIRRYGTADPKALLVVLAVAEIGALVIGRRVLLSLLQTWLRPSAERKAGAAAHP